MTPSPTQDAVQTALRTFLLAILPPGVEVVEAQDNRVPEVAAADFVTMTPMRRERIETNVDDFVDTFFTAAIAGATMTVSALAYGDIALGDAVFGVGLDAATKVTALGTGTGGVGTYTVSPAQTVASRGMASGVAEITQPTKLTFQLDVHGPASGDNAQVIATMMRDAYGVDLFAAQDPDSGAVPLYADDPRQAPFTNAEQQVENRWVVEAHLQANVTVRAPQQFAAQLEVQLRDVEALYPPA